MASAASLAGGGYKGNQNLVRSGYNHVYTQREIDEWIKCRDDVVYFAKKYIKIVNIDKGLMNFELWPYQEQLLRHFTDNRFVICKFPRQTGKTSCVVAWILHYIIFTKNVNVAILANKGATAREILSRLQLAYEWLPKFLQPGATIWNKGNIELGNGSKVLSAATSSDAVRGYTFNCISGAGRVSIKINEKIYETTLSEIYENAKSSKYMRYPERGTYVFSEEQIHDLVFPNSQEGKVSKGQTRRINGDTSHHPKGAWWEKFADGNGNASGASDTASSITKNGKNFRSEAKNAICVFSDVFGASGEMAQTTSFLSDSEPEDVELLTISEQDWEEAFGRNKTKNARGISEITSNRGTKTSSFFNDEGETLEIIRRNASETKLVLERKEKVQGTLGQNQQESREDCKNCGETSRNEAHRGIQTTNEFGRAWACAVEQGIEIQVLTGQGYKRFAGIKRTESQPTIRIRNEIECTRDHLIWNKEKWVKAHTLPHTKSIEQDVFDLIGVEDVSSFICNDVLVHNCIFFDEFAFIPNNVAEEFFNSVYPTISSGKKSRVFIVSTPNGMNKFYRMWMDAKKGESDYYPVEVNWWDVPGRDEKWKQQTIRNTSEKQFRQEFMCVTGKTLITVRNKKTGEIETLPIEQVYSRLTS